MRRKASSSKAAATGAKLNPNGAKLNPNCAIRARGNPQLAVKPTRRSTKTPTGRGLGKAGAKRLGRLLKRAVQQQEDAIRRTLSLPKTPVRLFKHLIQAEAEDAPQTSSTKAPSPPVPQLILSVVSQYKHRGGISMVELKQALAAGGYDVTKNNRRVTVTTQRLVNNETLVRTTRNATFRLNHKPETKQIRTNGVKSLRLRGDLKQSKTIQGAERSQRQARKTEEPKPKEKTHRAAARSHKPKEKTRKAAAKSHKHRGKTRKPAARSHKLKRKTHNLTAKSHKQTGKTAAKPHKLKSKTRKRTTVSHKPKSKTRKRTTVSHKLKSKTRKPAAKSHKSRKKTPRARRKSAKPAGRTQRQTPMARKRGLKKIHHPYKSLREIWPTRLRRRLKTGRHVPRRNAYYR